MKRYLLSFFVLLFVIPVTAQVNSLSAADIINRSIDSAGGKAFLLSVHTLYTDMTTDMEGHAVHWVTKEMLPNKGSFEILYNGRAMYKNWFNGKEGFETVNGKTQAADPAEFADKAYKKNIFDELDYLDPSLYTIELAGEEPVDGDNCYKIKTILPNGKKEFLFYSKSSFDLRKKLTLSNPDKDEFTTEVFSGYKYFGRLRYYSLSKLGDKEPYQMVKVENILINENVRAGELE